ncbi:MAG: ATP-dependent Clp protease adaptor ClpS [Ignavibacteriae bacterium]|nr:ATP-dependent Clp protease adaptor ClpS [Ignavibacteriota bacterium]
MEVKEKKQITTEDITDVIRQLILYNSNHMWDDVITQLQKATKYDIVHCEQIAVIAHTTGKATVKTGTLKELNLIDSVLKEIHLITEII